MSVADPVPPALTSLLMDDAIGRSALRKAGWRLIPLIAVGYGVAYMDRVNIGFPAARARVESNDVRLSSRKAGGPMDPPQEIRVWRTK
jgi:hypothetical protein